ncbi:MAG: type III-A CRISPR-associated RAMP protein Csm4, partial [Candidatus Methanofastidiosa archaeon]|nr:type III-A CRISPR-associated RAMP protein Csm4 [Candidatus Methanofastidiosa archaeon]
IGGKRSIGRGQFVPHKATVSLSLPEHPNRYTSLALYYPAAEERLSQDDSYALIERGGWIASNVPTSIKRKRVNMLAEGSVFRHCPRGMLVDVTPGGYPHPVYRSGCAFPLPVVVA